jgi:repressor LexA
MTNGQFPSVRDLMRDLSYKSPRSASLILESLISKGVLLKKDDGSLQLVFQKEIGDSADSAETVEIPLIGSVACGLPIYAKQNIEAYVPVSIRIAKPSSRYFILLAKGDSMNEKGINDGDLVLIRQQNTASNGDIVVALIDDDATSKKEFHHKGKLLLY